MVKASDSKSDGLCPRRFESCPLRNIFEAKTIVEFHLLHICVQFYRKEGHDVRCLISIENWTKWLLAFPVVYTAYGDFQFGHHEREIFAAHR